MYRHSMKTARSTPVLAAILATLALPATIPVALAAMPQPQSATNHVATRALMGNPQTPEGRYVAMHDAATGMPHVATALIPNALSARALLGDPQTPEGHYVGPRPAASMSHTATVAMAPSALTTRALMGDPETPGARFG